jgi:cytochrome c biogenesis protein CcdA
MNVPFFSKQFFFGFTPCFILELSPIVQPMSAKNGNSKSELILVTYALGFAHARLLLEGLLSN